jgi:hypothetical protein
MPCGCKNKQVKPVNDEDAILIDENILLNIKEMPVTNHDDCKISTNVFMSDSVSFKLFNVEGLLLHEATLLKYEPAETFVDIVHNFEKKTNYMFPNKKGISTEIASHTYVHKEVKDVIDLYSNQKIDLTTFQERIQKASEITYENSTGLKMEFEKVKSLFKI